MDRESTFVGGPLTITADIFGMELSERKIVGVFLTTGTFGVDDSPDNSGWTVISDNNGGSSNYVEIYVLDSDEGISVSWSLSAPSTEGITTFHVGIQHGGDGIARLGDIVSRDIFPLDFLDDWSCRYCMVLLHNGHV